MANPHPHPHPPHPYLMPNNGIHIYQDNIFQNPMSMIPQARMAQAPAPAAPKNRRPLQAANSNMMLNPPSRPSRTTMSPQKLAPASAPAPLAALKPSQRNKLQPIPMAPPTSYHQNTDSLQKKPFMSQFKTAAQAPTIHSTAQFGKENVRPNYLSATGTMSFAYDFLQSQPPPKAAGKRTLMDAPNIKDSRPTKKTKTTEEPRDVEIPPYDSFPPIVDDGLKPGHSYATLIGMAILRSPNRQLTLSQIYKWISDTYSFYPSDDAGWQNSIRHNLSLHKAFYKMERPKDDPGKGNYWRIEAGLEHQFLKEKPTRRFNSSNPASETVIQARPGTAKDKEKNKTQSAQSRSQAQSRPQARPSTAKPRRQPTPMEPTLPPSQPVSEARVNMAALPPLPTSQATISPPDLSSDATIPISDAVSPDDDEKPGMPEFVHGTQYSPLPPTMHSSPPVRHSVDFVVGTTPPPLGRNPTSSGFRSQTRAFVSMDDSGYISSLDSSVMRQKPISLLTSETDRPPRIKRGRAEEEIARLRASSPHSPSKGRSWNGYAPMSSSPLRQESKSIFPLTPALQLKAPTRPPPSVSPNTSLQMHRSRISMMLQSPLRKMTGDTAFDSSTFPYSPAFTLDNTVFGVNTGAFMESYDWAGLHDDDNDLLNFASFAPDNSPTKRSARRSRMDRSHSTSALPNTASSSFASRLTSNVPTLRVWEDDTADPAETPSRAPQKASTEGLPPSPSPLMRTPSKQPNAAVQAESNWTGLNEMLFDPSKFAEDESQDISGLDILQGFQKIGSGAQASG